MGANPYLALTRSGSVMFDLQTLGQLELKTAHGERVHAVQARAKDLALLTYLATARPFGFQRRDTLLALLWPDLDLAHGRNALSQALHRLRVSLAPGVLVVQGRDDVGVSAQGLSCDAATFECYLQVGELVRALRLYAGDFLAGFHVCGAAPEFDDWIVTERERLQRRAFNATLVLVDVAEASGDCQAAVGWLRRASELRPVDETICQRLIKAQAAAGDRAGALAAYDHFARQLADEYGLSPSAETRAGADAVRGAPVTGGGPEGPRRTPADPKVVEAFLKGRYFTSTMVQTAHGLRYLETAIKLDPAYAPAHAARAMAIANLALLGHLPPGDARVAVEGAARRALELDPDFGDAHAARATAAMMFDWDWEAAEREFRIATSASPNSADAHAYFAICLCAVGRCGEGVTEATVAQQLDPLGLWANFILAWTLFRARRHEESIRRLQALLELYPHFAFAHLFLAENHLATRSYAEATGACRSAVRILPEDQLLLGLTACVVGLSGHRDWACRLQRQLDALTGSRYVCPGHMAAAHLGLGDRDRAFDCWEAMCRDRSPLACLVATDPLYDCVRDDPRFGELRRRLNLPERSPEMLQRRDAAG